MSIDAQTPTRWPDGYMAARDGVQIHFVETGAGIPVLLLHGAGGSAVGSWFSNGIAPRLAETNRAIAFDLRGYGMSGGHQHDLEAMAADTIEFMDQHGLSQAHFAGYSMGGQVMARLMALAPGRFITASFQGAGISETREWARRVPKDNPGTDPDEERALARARERRAAKGQAVGNDLFDAMERMMTRVIGRSALNATEDFVGRMMAHSTGLDLTTIKFPVMAINGEFDRPHARTHRLARELSDFTNVILPGKGHLTAMMAGFIPDAYADEYCAFVAKHNPPAGR